MSGLDFFLGLYLQISECNVVFQASDDNFLKVFNLRNAKYYSMSGCSFKKDLNRV